MTKVLETYVFKDFSLSKSKCVDMELHRPLNAYSKNFPPILCSQLIVFDGFLCYAKREHFGRELLLWQK